MSHTWAKAWTYETTKGGLLQNLRLDDIQIPESKQDHILIEVLNASLNSGDTKFPDTPIISHLITRPASPCFDFCGRIRVLPLSLVPDSRNLHVGQIVFGVHMDLKTPGTLKTMMWVRPESLYPLPENVLVDHGAALGVAALTARQVIAPYAKPGSKVLINGGTGGVGTFCIQIAKAFDMHVIATCSDAGAQLCKDLGADEVIDYKSPTFLTDLSRTQVDLVIDNVGNDPDFHRRSESFLKSNGLFVLVALMAENWTGIRSMLISYLCPRWLGGPQRKWKAVFTQRKTSDFEALAVLVREGKIKVVVDSVFPFHEAPSAFKRLKSGRAKGKILVDMSTYGT